MSQSGPRQRFAPSRAARWMLPLAGFLVSACANGSSRPIRLGLTGAFSGPIGKPMLLSARLAVAEINAAGGIRGRPLELVERDDYADPDSAVVAAMQLYNSDVVAVVGHLSSGTTLAAAPIYNGGRRPVVALSPSASAPEVRDAGPYIFRICPSDLAHGAALARWARERLQLSRGAVLYLNDDYGRGVRRTFVEEFRRLDGEVVSSDPYLGTTPDVGPYLDRIAHHKRAQFLVVAGNRAEAESIIRNARARGIAVPVMGGDGLQGIEQSGELAEGVYETAAYFPLLNSAANQRFLQAFSTAYPDAPPPNQPGASTYDAVYLLRDVIARAGTDRESIRRALGEVGQSQPAFEGVTGKIAFDSLGDVPTRSVYVGVVRSSVVMLVGGL